MDGLVARGNCHLKSAPKQAHQGVRLALEAGRKCYSANFQVIASLGQNRFDAWINVLEVGLMTSWKRRLGAGFAAVAAFMSRHELKPGRACQLAATALHQ